MKDKVQQILREEVNDAISRLRIVFRQMKALKGADEYLERIYMDKKQPYGGYEPLLNGIMGILKLMGRQEVNYTEHLDLYYWFTKAFMVNGGYGRDFKEGEIQLIELPVYEVEANYTEEVFEFRTGWGEVIGVTSEQEALDRFNDNAANYIDDSETNDTDYGDIFDVEDAMVQATRWIKFKPQWVGL